MALTDKQERLCRKLAAGMLQKDAAIAAGYSPKTAEAQASQQLKNPKVRKRLDELRKKEGKADENLRERVLKELQLLAFSNVKKLVNGNNLPLELKHLPDEVTAAVQSVDVEVKTFKGNQTVTSKLKMHSKESALNQLAKHLGLFEMDNKQKQPKTVVDLSGLSLSDLEKLAGQ